MSNEAADQVVRISLNGAEVAAKLTGSAAKQIAVLLYAVLKDQKRTKGKMRLSSMLRSGKELKVFSLKDENLKKFCEAAKKYGILYTVLKDRNAKDGICDIMVRAEDASKVNRIVERFGFSSVIVADVRTELVRKKEEKTGEKDGITLDPGIPDSKDDGKKGDSPAMAVAAVAAGGSLDDLIDQMMSQPAAKEDPLANPGSARTEKTEKLNPSVPSSEPKDRSDKTPAKPSVRKQLEEIKAAQEKPKAKQKELTMPNVHKKPKKKKTKGKGGR